jgi:Fe-S oxidoreductase
MQQPKLSAALLRLKAEGVKAVSVPILLSGSGGCTMTMEHGLRKSTVNVVVMHPAELLAASYGYYSAAARAANIE